MENKINSKFLKRREQNPITNFIDISLNSISFKMLTVKSDDTTVHDFFYNDYINHSLDLWIKWCKKGGVFIDVGAHTGIFTLACLYSNNLNKLIAIEPSPINFYRILTNLRLNDPKLLHRSSLFNNAASNETKNIKFDFRTDDDSYLSKGGRIDETGINLKAIKLDDLNFSDANTKINAIKIDTEGEDLKVLVGSLKLIEKHKPNIIIETRKSNIREIKDLLIKIGYTKIYYFDDKGIKEYDFKNVFNKNRVLDLVAEYF
jgi:FkbM family methyltransferase